MGGQFLHACRLRKKLAVGSFPSDDDIPRNFIRKGASFEYRNNFQFTFIHGIIPDFFKEFSSLKNYKERKRNRCILEI